MKVVKSILIGAVITVAIGFAYSRNKLTSGTTETWFETEQNHPMLQQSVAIQTPAQAENRPQFCEININNVSQYVSQNNPLINQAPSTPYRPFIQNNQPYYVNKELIAQPLYYATLSGGSIATAFQLRGKYGNTIINDNDIVVQHIEYYQSTSSFRIAGLCVNGVFIPSKGEQFNSILKLPENTINALNEASLSIAREQMANLAR